jgi:quinol monooxygenase YgiN
MADGELLFYVKLYVRPERVEEWKRAAFEIIGMMSKEDAFVECHLQQDTQDSNLFTLYERWREPTVAAFLENQMKPYRREYEAKLPALLLRPREASVLTSLGVWRREGQ